MKLPKLEFPKPGRKKEKQLKESQKNESVQGWLPVQDIAEGMIYQKDGRPSAVVKVEPAAFRLLSDREKQRRIASLFEAIQALPGQVQIIAVPRPIDLDQYIKELEEKQKEADKMRKRVLRGYTGYVKRIAAGAEAMEKRFFILVVGEKKREDELLKKASEFVGELKRAELEAHICNYRETLDMLFSFFHSAQAAFERVQDTETISVTREAI